MLALLLSLLVHLVAGGIIGRWGERIAGVVARLVPRPTPTPEDMAATSDIITIEKKHTVPRVARRAQPEPKPQPRSIPRPERVAQLSAPLAQSVPTALPLPTQEPTSAPTFTPKHGTIHHPQSSKATAPRAVARIEPVQAPPADMAVRGAQQPSNRLSSAQIAALESQMRQTIAQTHVALNDAVPQRQPPSTMKSYKLIMAGTLDDVQSAQGLCKPIDTKRTGGYIWHIQDCTFVYKDGYSEHVTIPWWQRYAPGDDPADHPWKRYVVQPPPDGPAPSPLNFSRLVCTFYKAQCQALIDRENAAGGRPVSQ